MKNKTNKLSTFKYNPKGGILCISTNETLGFNFNTNKFEINQNPEGNSKFKPIINIELNAGSIEFDTNYRDKVKHCCFYSSSKVGNVLINFFQETENQNLPIDRDKDLDNFSIIFEGDTIYRMDFYKKSIDYKMLASVSVYNKDNTLYVRMPMMNKLCKIKTYFFQGSLLYFQTDKNETISYKIDVSPIILNCIRRLLECTDAYENQIIGNK
ncbi:MULTISPECIES: hypothetical protein [Bacteroides]|jgi:hypothetical protein|uniref:hypothetical protein n=1 Tax=Bacteroides TaxID=816 RepID=UPI001896F7ED|nr:hypothetical protein [Bacteroides congonensis]